jgi:hypothetical protein
VALGSTPPASRARHAQSLSADDSGRSRRQDLLQLDVAQSRLAALCVWGQSKRAHKRSPDGRACQARKASKLKERDQQQFCRSEAGQRQNAEDDGRQSSHCLQAGGAGRKISNDGGKRWTSVGGGLQDAYAHIDLVASQQRSAECDQGEGDKLHRRDVQQRQIPSTMPAARATKRGGHPLEMAPSPASEDEYLASTTFSGDKAAARWSNKLAPNTMVARVTRNVGLASARPRIVSPTTAAPATNSTIDSEPHSRLTTASVTFTVQISFPKSILVGKGFLPRPTFQSAAEIAVDGSGGAGKFSAKLSRQ